MHYKLLLNIISLFGIFNLLFLDFRHSAAPFKSSYFPKQQKGIGLSGMPRNVDGIWHPLGPEGHWGQRLRFKWEKKVDHTFNPSSGQCEEENTLNCSCYLEKKRADHMSKVPTVLGDAWRNWFLFHLSHSNRTYYTLDTWCHKNNNGSLGYYMDLKSFQNLWTGESSEHDQYVMTCTHGVLFSCKDINTKSQEK